MLLTSSQSSTHRPLGLSVEELFALDRQYRRVEQQSAQQNRSRVVSANLNRLSSRSMDLVSSPMTNQMSPLPSLEVHGYSYQNRYQTTVPSTSNVSRLRSSSSDQLNIAPVLRTNYLQRSINNELNELSHANRYQNDYQNSYVVSNRNACKLRRRAPIKRESSRRIAVRPMVHRRRAPSTGSSIESIDKLQSSSNFIPIQQPKDSIAFEPSRSLVEDVIDDLVDETKQLNTRSFDRETENDDNQDKINLFELRVPIGKTYDTSDISVQLEGSKILVHCHTIESTDRRGNYRKHEFKTELIVPEIVDDDTIVSYLTEQGELIIEGKYHSWAWKQMKSKRKNECNETKHVQAKNSSNRHDGTENQSALINSSNDRPTFVATGNHSIVLLPYFAF